MAAEPQPQMQPPFQPPAALPTRSIVFGVNRKSEYYENLDGVVEFFAFGEGLSWVYDELGKPLEKKGNYIGIDREPIATPFTTLDHCHYFASYASFGSEVYRVGGNYRRCDKCSNRWDGRRIHPPISRDVDINHVFSTSVDRWDAATNCWKSTAKLNLGRKSPHLHILEGMLYAVGGYYPRHNNFLFMEVLCRGNWSAIPNPPESVELDLNRFVSATVEEKGCILFGSEASTSFYAYTPPETWERLNDLPFDSEMLNECLGSPAFVVDNHLILLDIRCGTKLVGLSLDSGHYFSICLAKEGLLPSAKCHHYRPKLLHCGEGVLALVWRDKGCYLQCKGGRSLGEVLKQYHKNDSFSGYHCCCFWIDFEKAHLGGCPCVIIGSHQKCIAPNFFEICEAAFIVDTRADMISDYVRESNMGSALQPRKRRLKSKLHLFV